jgi:hypothetical protein
MGLRKALLAVVGAAALLGALVGFASARRLSSSSQTFRMMFSRLEWENGFVRARCPVTLEGSLHARTIAKVSGTLVGYITSVPRGMCTLNTMTVLTETLPWHVRYSAFAGGLPTIFNLTLHVIGFSIRAHEAINELNCLSTPSTAERPVRLIVGRELSGALREPVIGGEVPSEAACINSPGRYSNGEGISNVTALNSSARVTLTLI